jgi:hypothetical protein
LGANRERGVGRQATSATEFDSSPRPLLKCATLARPRFNRSLRFTMSEEPPAKRIRKGTKSCQECRHRKTRCIWPSDNAQVCQGCHTRNKTCELQVEIVQTSETAKLTSRTRIDALEKQVSDLWNAINQSPPVALDRQHHVAQGRPMTVDGTSARVQSQTPTVGVLSSTLSVALQSVVTSNRGSKEI